MLARRLLLLALVLAGTSQAAPAPLHKAEPAQPEVQLSGWLRDQRLAAGAPSVITRQSDYHSVAAAYGIENPPRVDFRTHFLFVHVWGGYGNGRWQIDGKGDLHAAAGPDLPFDGLERLGSGRRPGARFLIKSFPRSAVKTVNGVALPRK